VKDLPSNGDSELNYNLDIFCGFRLCDWVFSENFILTIVILNILTIVILNILLTLNLLS